MVEVELEDIEFISMKPRVRGKVILDDWSKTLRFEEYKWIHSFEGFDGLDSRSWIAPLTSRGEDIIRTYEENKHNIDTVNDFFNLI